MKMQHVCSLRGVVDKFKNGNGGKSYDVLQEAEERLSIVLYFSVAHGSKGNVLCHQTNYKIMSSQ